MRLYASASARVTGSVRARAGMVSSSASANRHSRSAAKHLPILNFVEDSSRCVASGTAPELAAAERVAGVSWGRVASAAAAPGVTGAGAAGEPSGPGVPGGRVPIGVGVSASLCPPASGARRLSSSALA